MPPAPRDKAKEPSAFFLWTFLAAWISSPFLLTWAGFAVLEHWTDMEILAVWLFIAAGGIVYSLWKSFKEPLSGLGDAVGSIFWLLGVVGMIAGLAFGFGGDGYATWW